MSAYCARSSPKSCSDMCLLIPVPTQIKPRCNLLVTGCLGGLGNFHLMPKPEISPRQGILSWLGDSEKKDNTDKMSPL